MNEEEQLNALFLSNTETVDRLISNKIIKNINMLNNYGNNALVNSDLDKVKVLVKHGININNLNNSGISALEVNNKPGVFEYLISQGADLNIFEIHVDLSFLNVKKLKTWSEQIRLLKDNGFDFIGEYKNRLVHISDVEVFEELKKQDCLKDGIPIVKFFSEHRKTKVQNSLLVNFELYPEIINFLLEDKKFIFDTVKNYGGLNKTIELFKENDYISISEQIAYHFEKHLKEDRDNLYTFIEEDMNLISPEEKKNKRL